MSLRQSTWCWVAVLFALAVSVSCAVDNTRDNQREVFESQTHIELLQSVFGRTEVYWQIAGTKWEDQGQLIDKSAILVYQPFRSSAALCRTYATEVHVPGWVCDGDGCQATSKVTYDVSSKAFVALVPKESSVDCDALDFERDYFELERDLHDIEVLRLVGSFQESFQAWKSTSQSRKDSCDLKQLGQDDLLSIEMAPIAGGAKVSFALRNPCYEKHRVIFEMTMEGREVADYQLYENIP